jgi:hypothetical protein
LRGIKKGAYLLYEADNLYVIHIEELHKGHYKTVYHEIKAEKSRKKKFECFFCWTTIKKFKSEAKRLKLSVLKKADALNHIKVVERIMKAAESKKKRQ